MSDLIDRCDEAVRAAERFLAAAKSRVAAKVTKDGKISAALLDSEQRATHGFAWVATYVEALRQLARWARHLENDGKFGAIEELLLKCGFAEYLAQLPGGIAMSQNEVVRPYDLGLSDEDTGALWTPAVAALVKE